MYNTFTKKKVKNYFKTETACFTGHRPLKLPWGYDESKISCIKFKEDLKEILKRAINYGLKNFMTGMAEGFDMIATEILIDLKKEYKYIKIIAVIPCLGQERKWSINQQKRYKSILKKCDKKVILQKSYTPTCMNDRNKYMIDNSSVVIACYNGLKGGTKNTINYAKLSNCKLKIINPNDYI